ncbi:hypothetical protein GCM10029976_042340 [Kribbella albertanoniae]|uniref:Uncharacterized protein n=1 Tax=Kribbella albertanoniae TaxID=1266829 RepID=A0A4R4QEY0_9ACTN|nr:hypothetical protein [Kribbella albertanoniae]TDC34020.1 hypothetical protein E1261_04760 [Kribbella albertanoniae]
MTLLIVAVALRLACIGTYAIATYRRTASPNLVSWSFWMLTPLIAGVAQHFDGRGAAAWLSISYAVGPALILVIGLTRGHSSVRLTRADVVCAVCAGGGLMLWQITDSPLWAICFSILTDITAALPTIIKAYRQPLTEPLQAYALSILAAVVALAGLGDWRLTSIAFALCVLCLDLVILATALVRRSDWSSQERDRAGGLRSKSTEPDVLPPTHSTTLEAEWRFQISGRRPRT